MTDFYVIERDGFKYQELDLEVNDFIDDFPEDIDYGQAHDFSLENLSLSGFWKPLRTGFSKIEGESNLIPDVTLWIDATLFLSPRAYRVLFDSLKPYGEFLPVHIDSDVYYIFNCLTAVDLESDDMSDKFVFKSISGGCVKMYGNERFKTAIESFEIEGLDFKPE